MHVNQRELENYKGQQRVRTLQDEYTQKAHDSRGERKQYAKARRIDDRGESERQRRLTQVTMLRESAVEGLRGQRRGLSGQELRIITTRRWGSWAAGEKASGS